jgi:hypothetical protein
MIHAAWIKSQIRTKVLVEVVPPAGPSFVVAAKLVARAEVASAFIRTPCTREISAFIKPHFAARA